MNAIQPSGPPLKPQETRQVPRKRTQRRRHPYRATAIHTTAKLVVNLLLIFAAGSAIAKLLPYYLSQQQKIHEIQAEFHSVEGRVERLRADLNRYFDPQQAQSVMREQSNRFEPGQRPLILQKK
jgi:hypothetical protein